MNQKELNFPKFTHGGRREGAGRPNIKGECAHLKRPKIHSIYPLYIKLSTREDVPSLKKKNFFKAFVEAAHASKAFYIRIVAFKIQSKCVELVVECANNQVLTQGLKSISIRLAKNINKEIRKNGQQRKGSLFFGRYKMVLLNDRNILWKTMSDMFPLPTEKKTFDEYSSEIFFSAWDTLYGARWKQKFKNPNTNWLDERKKEAEKILSAPKFLLSRKILSGKTPY